MEKWIEKIDIPKNTTVLDIVSILERIIGKEANYELIEEGGSPEVDNSDIQQIALKLGISFGDKYVESVIKQNFKSI